MPAYEATHRVIYTKDDCADEKGVHEKFFRYDGAADAQAERHNGFCSHHELHDCATVQELANPVHVTDEGVMVV